MNTQLSIDKSICIGCDGCIAICPATAIFNNKILPDIDTNKCIACLLCMSFCPIGAIKEDDEQI